MKNLSLIYAVLLLTTFASCKKGSNQDSASTQPPDPVINAVRDSVSYTIDGNTYTVSGTDLNPISSGGEDANRTLTYPDPTKKYEYALVGSQDSILHFQKCRISSGNGGVILFFVKKFTRQPIIAYWPPLKDVLTMFTVGKHALAEDFEWQNSQNGVAFDVSANNKVYSSYNAYNNVNTITIPRGFQKGSSFEIISFIKATYGYNLEAKFTTVVIDPATGNQKQLSNGYLRLNISPAYGNTN